VLLRRPADYAAVGIDNLIAFAADGEHIAELDGVLVEALGNTVVLTVTEAKTGTPAVTAETQLERTLEALVVESAATREPFRFRAGGRRRSAIRLSVEPYVP
jgi:hypothetical protein